MVRIYCLSRISRISPSNNYLLSTPYDDNADEVVLNDNGYHEVCNRDTFLPDYLLTEICIGWKAVEDGTKKVYELQVFRKNTMLLTFRMVRGMISIENVDLTNGSFELYFATSKFLTFSHKSSPNFDLKINVIFIKNTTVRKIITTEEELAYSDYAKNFSKFISENMVKYPGKSAEDLQAEAIIYFGPLILPNQTRPKFLRQKLRDFQQAIHLLCDPQTGSYANIPVNEYHSETKKFKVCRFYQQIECLLFSKQATWHAKETRTLQQHKDKFSDCIYLDWANTTLRNMDSTVFAFQNLQAIDFDNVDLGESLQYWYSFAANVSFKELMSLTFRNCRIQYLDDTFFQLLSRETMCLSFIDNDIRKISPAIMKLAHLNILDLSNNKNLSEDGIPWSLLPSTLAVINLEDTNIVNIPISIWHLKSLTDLKVSSPGLQNISWTDINQHIQKISINGGGNEINDVGLHHVHRAQLSISNLKLKKLDAFDLPCCLTSLHLINTHLGTFNTSNITCRSNDFEELNLSGNELKIFSWEGCPKELKRLTLSNNLFKDISIKEKTLSFADFTLLTIISFEHNKLYSLPQGFENLQQLRGLNLNSNCFNYDECDLLEVLWHRLPRTLISLNLSNNNIATIPCFLRNFNLFLRVENCNLHYCCPYLHANVHKNETYMTIDASNNPNLNLSFIPSTIYKLPRVADIKPTTGKSLYPQDLIIPNYANFPTTTLKGNFCDTSKTIYSKAVYKFCSENVEQNDKYACKCCGMCGKNTEERLFKQQMAMDSILLIQKEEGIEDTKSTTYHSNFKPPIYYEPGKWRTEVKSRLCVCCKKLLIEKINMAFDEKTKKKKRNDGNLNENIHEPISNELRRKSHPQPKQQNSEYIYDETSMEAEPSVPQLPPIQTLYPNNEGWSNNFPSTSNPFYQSPRFENTEQHVIDRLERNTFDESTLNYNEKNLTSFVSNFPPQRTILLDEYGRECAIWESQHSTSSNIIPACVRTFTQDNFSPPVNEGFTTLTDPNFDEIPESLLASDEILYWCNL